MRFSRYDEVSSLIPAVPWFLLSKYLFSAGPSEPSKRYIRESFKACASSNPVLLKLFFTALAVAALCCAGFFFQPPLSLQPIDLGCSRTSISTSACLPRKEVIQPHLPIRLPCYDFTPVIWLTFGSWLLAVTSLTSGAPNSHGVTGGVYKARERIHRGMLIRDY